MKTYIYDFNPCEMLEIYDGSLFVSVDKFITGEEIHDEGTIVRIIILHTNVKVSK